MDPSEVEHANAVVVRVELDRQIRERAVRELVLSRLHQNAALSARAERWVPPPVRRVLKGLGLALCVAGLLLSAFAATLPSGESVGFALVSALLFAGLALVFLRADALRPMLRGRSIRFASRQIVAQCHKNLGELIRLEPDLIEYRFADATVRGVWSKDGTTLRESTLELAGVGFAHAGDALLALYAHERALSPRIVLIGGAPEVQRLLVLRGVRIEALPPNPPVGYPQPTSS